MKKFVFIFCSVIMFSMITTNSNSQDWPQFRGQGRDSKVTGFKAPATWPSELSQVWKIQVGTGDATPALAGSRIYLNTRQGENEIILCIDAKTGKEIWRNEYPSVAVTGPAASHPGPRGTPAVMKGKVVTYGASGILSCCDAATGKLLWRRENKENIYPQFFTGMSPLLTDNLCIAHLGGKDKGQVVAIDIETGKDKWIWNGDGPSYASPSLMTTAGNKQVVIQSEKNLVGLNLSDGKVLWQTPAAPAQRFYNSVSPYINGNIIFISGQGTGTKAIKAGTVAEELWSNTEAGSKWTTPILKDGYLYGFSDQKRIYCINSETGKTAWIDNTVTSDFATISDCGEVIMGLPSTGTLLVFKPDPAGYSELARYKVAETPVYSFPIIAGNDIYIKDAEHLTLFRIK